MTGTDGRAAVIFDFDGVLADTEPLHLRATQRTFQSVGWVLEDRDYFDRYLGFNDRDLFTAFARDHGLGLPPDRLEALLAEKARRFDAAFAAGQALFPGASDCVRRLAAVFRLGIASGALRNEIDAVLAAAGLAAAFSAIVSADDPVAGKPSPDPYVTAAARLEVAAADCLAIEDSPWGLVAATDAGMRTIGITTSYRADALSQATRVVTGLDQITVALVRSLLEAS